MRMEEQIVQHTEEQIVKRHGAHVNHRGRAGSRFPCLPIHGEITGSPRFFKDPTCDTNSILSTTVTQLTRSRLAALPVLPGFLALGMCSGTLPISKGEEYPDTSWGHSRHAFTELSHTAKEPYDAAVSSRLCETQAAMVLGSAKPHPSIGSSRQFQS